MYDISLWVSFLDFTFLIQQFVPMYFNTAITINISLVRIQLCQLNLVSHTVVCKLMNNSKSTTNANL